MDTVPVLVGCLRMRFGTDFTELKALGRLPPKSVLVGSPECKDDIDEFWALLILFDKPTCDERFRLSFGDLASEFCEDINRFAAV